MRTAGLVLLFLLAPLTAAATTEIVIESGALTPPVLTIESDEPVGFTNCSGRIVHVEFFGRADEHHVFQVPGRIRAIFHRPGRHPYVVHFETTPRAELRGFVDVRETRPGALELFVCRGPTVEEVCIEP